MVDFENLTTDTGIPGFLKLLGQLKADQDCLTMAEPRAGLTKPVFEDPELSTYLQDAYFQLFALSSAAPIADQVKDNEAFRQVRSAGYWVIVIGENVLIDTGSFYI